MKFDIRSQKFSHSGALQHPRLKTVDDLKMFHSIDIKKDILFFTTKRGANAESFDPRLSFSE